MSFNKIIEEIIEWNLNTFQPLFIDDFINIELREKGYSIINLNIENGLTNLINDSDIILKKIIAPPSHFYNFGQLSDFELRNLSYDSIQKNLLPGLHEIVNNQMATIIAGTHLIKPSGYNSYFSAHQDNNMVDERKNKSYSFWIPLQNITDENGAFYVMEKSHLLGNVFRSTSIPWAFKDVVENVKKLSIPLYPQKGQAIIFDASLIHFSNENLSNWVRIAINILVIPKNKELIKCIYKRFRLFNDIDIFKINIDYYLNENCEKKPSEKYLKIEEVRRNLNVLNENEFNLLLKNIL